MPLKDFLVEDSPLVLKSLQALLATVPGMQVSGHAGGATDALCEIRAAQPDVVILDLKLSQGGGFDVLQELHLQDLDVFIFSSHSDESHRRLARQLGAKAFFDKPLELKPLLAALTARLAHPEC